MSQQDQDTKKPDETVRSRDLLKKSAELRERAALLKQQMEETQKACNEILHPEPTKESDQTQD